MLGVMERRAENMKEEGVCFGLISDGIGEACELYNV